MSKVRLVSNCFFPRALVAVAMAQSLVLAATAWAGVQVVDCANGPLTTIQQGVDAAVDGDTVLIEPCALGAYPPFVVAGKSDLHIVGNGGRDVLPVGLPSMDFRPDVEVFDDPNQGPFNCVDINNSDDVTVSGITFGNCGFHAVNISNSSGVRIASNRFGDSFETVRDSSVDGSQIVGNLFVGGAFAIFIDSSNALVAQNVILANKGSGISVLSPGASGNEVMNNIIRGAALESIFTAANGTRIERNLCENSGGSAEIILSNLTNDSIVVGNVTGDSISDGGANNVVLGNQ